MSSRTVSFFIFFSMFLTVYGSANYYIIKRGWQCLPDITRLKRAYIVLALIWAFSYLTGRILENLSPGFMANTLIWIGSSWLGFMAYFFMILIPLDIVRLFNHRFHFFPESWGVNPRKIRLITGCIVFGTVAMANLYGYINACHVRLKPLDIAIDKRAGSLKKLRIVFASDIHLGTIVGEKRLKRMAEMMNEQDPDLVLFGGDIVDEGLHPETHREITEILKSINARYGVFASTGNHELIVGIEKSQAFIAASGIRLLRDEAVTVDGSFVLAGREDASFRRFTEKNRKSLEKILEKTDLNLPLILMDHTPYTLSEAEETGVDLQLSGHTHNGQMWPFNYITGLIFEQDWGRWRRSDTLYYVSCGAGVWGPPVRIGSYPEIVVINVTFGGIDR
ncbi:MAG: metallophosphoesterase [Chitinivibrionales bacterium]|nr:metallophosphoesterase [Chitinivibrionales bacterium]